MTPSPRDPRDASSDRPQDVDVARKALDAPGPGAVASGSQDHLNRPITADDAFEGLPDPDAGPAPSREGAREPWGELIDEADEPSSVEHIQRIRQKLQGASAGGPEAASLDDTVPEDAFDLTPPMQTNGVLDLLVYVAAFVLGVGLGIAALLPLAADPPTPDEGVPVRAP